MAKNEIVEAQGALSPEEQKQLTAILAQELEVSQQGFEFKPIRFKINKDSCTFVDPLGNSTQELRGVIILKQRVRGYWNRAAEDNVPECSSQDGEIGIASESGEERRCLDCPLNRWGSGEDESGQVTRGKACKEMRRIFILPEGYHLPIMLTLPPTSIRNLDAYMSARLTQRIPDIAQETIISLSSEKSGKFSYAVAKFRTGDKVEPRRILELSKLRQSIQKSASSLAVEDEEYTQGNADTHQTTDMDEEQPF